ncbi:nucleotidyltransferase [Liquorilactobacillus oeni]|uniref:tRNA(Met) cytidine acetate ligase n=1 Tax=Liquorilactobacillus oeni DSM 19972 TaxID=1423777 RepID=A0A0R1MHL6_9LACO|nr:nucleotidyltransferase [Liquorilactobacillus oeni]KRL04738.1 hypothetical protein FD46_GL001875 [Liquorilactobacillus oeni DSM 19972]
MVVVGIIAEYNPFHNGHLYQLEETRKLFPRAVFVVVMSGNFLERGEPACVDKWTRANEALHCGVDLVVELPVAFCVQPADRFATGAVLLLKKLGVQKLIFGAEHASYNFKKLAQQVSDVRGDSVKYNESFAAAYQRAVEKKVGHAIDQPNDLLGLAYAKANLQLGDFLELIPIQRKGAFHHDLCLEKDHSLASASAIRARLAKGSIKEIAAYVPQITSVDFATRKLITWADFWPLLRYRLLTAPYEELRNLYDVTEGLEYRMKQQVQKLPLEADFEDWLGAVKSKRYTYTHLSRLAVIVLLQVTEEEVKSVSKNPYLRLLGFTPKGQKFLHKLKKRADIPLITKASQKLRKKFLSVDYRAGLVYELACMRVQDHGKAPLRITAPSLSRKKR